MTWCIENDFLSFYHALCSSLKYENKILDIFSSLEKSRLLHIIGPVSTPRAHRNVPRKWKKTCPASHRSSSNRLVGSTVFRFIRPKFNYVLISINVRSISASSKKKKKTRSVHSMLSVLTRKSNQSYVNFNQSKQLNHSR